MFSSASLNMERRHHEYNNNNNNNNTKNNNNKNQLTAAQSSFMTNRINERIAAAQQQQNNNNNNNHRFGPFSSSFKNSTKSSSCSSCCLRFFQSLFGSRFSRIFLIAVICFTFVLVLVHQVHLHFRQRKHRQHLINKYGIHRYKEMMRNGEDNDDDNDDNENGVRHQNPHHDARPRLGEALLSGLSSILHFPDGRKLVDAKWEVDLRRKKVKKLREHYISAEIEKRTRQRAEAIASKRKRSGKKSYRRRDDALEEAITATPSNDKNNNNNNSYHHHYEHSALTFSNEELDEMINFHNLLQQVPSDHIKMHEKIKKRENGNDDDDERENKQEEQTLIIDSYSVTREFDKIFMDHLFEDPETHKMMNLSSVTYLNIIPEDLLNTPAVGAEQFREDTRDPLFATLINVDQVKALIVYDGELSQRDRDELQREIIDRKLLETVDFPLPPTAKENAAELRRLRILREKIKEETFKLKPTLQQPPIRQNSTRRKGPHGRRPLQQIPTVENCVKRNRVQVLPSFTRHKKHMRPKIAILSLVAKSKKTNADNTTRRAMMHEFTFLSKMHYARKHSYDLIIEDETAVDKSRPPHWSKIRVLRKWLPFYEYVVWMDQDVLPTNLDVKIEDIVEDEVNRFLLTDLKEQEMTKFLKPEYTTSNDRFPAFKMKQIDLILTHDGLSGINSGVMFFRRSKWSLNILRRMYAVPPELTKPFHDQGALRYLITPGYRGRKGNEAVIDLNHVWDVPDNFFNSYPQNLIFRERDMGDEWQKGDFAVHFASCGHYPYCLQWVRYFYEMSQCNNTDSFDPPHDFFFDTATRIVREHEAIKRQIDFEAEKKRNATMKNSSSSSKSDRNKKAKEDIVDPVPPLVGENSNKGSSATTTLSPVELFVASHKSFAPSSLMPPDDTASIATYPPLDEAVWDVSREIYSPGFVHDYFREKAKTKK